MIRRKRLRLLLSDDDAQQVRQWLAPLLAQRRHAEAERRRRLRRQRLVCLWLLVLVLALLARYF
ncbi:hypothetical protein [Stenotrophomonas sp.]|uniref:hypothetical protein n=1 Tax=Stenotrophomonas sp. TaxID=69392 RepID=UPI0028B07E5A|nr:hypothetical protein [Stenotrophomonas sp.]